MTGRWACTTCGVGIGHAGRGLFGLTGWHKNMVGCDYQPTIRQKATRALLKWTVLGVFFALCLEGMWRSFVAFVIGTS